MRQIKASEKTTVLNNKCEQGFIFFVGPRILRLETPFPSLRLVPEKDGQSLLLIRGGVDRSFYPWKRRMSSRDICPPSRGPAIDSMNWDSIV